MKYSAWALIKAHLRANASTLSFLAMVVQSVSTAMLVRAVIVLRWRCP